MPKHPWTPYVITRNLRSFAFSPDNAVHFLYGAVLHRPVLLPPLHSVFAKETAFFSAKAQNCKKLRFLRLFAGFFMEESCFCLWKAKETALLKKRQNSRERGNQRFRCDGFPSPLDPHPFLSPTRGAPLDPLCNHPKLMEFRICS